MISLFKKKKDISVSPLTVDVHSHLLPGLDDGVQSMDESIAILSEMSEIGYEKVITTPHVIADHYPNTPETIYKSLRELREKIKEVGLNIQVQAAAEYYLDDHLLEKLENNDALLTFGDNYLLFETSFINQPSFLVEAVFKISALGLKPVLAHPERYLYLQQNESLLSELLDRGVHLQINLNSLTGYYSKPARKFAEKLIERGQVSFIGSDCHNSKHMESLKRATQMRYFEKATNQGLLNNML
ncbi:capsular biosynthesis protein [Fulvivirgaceae bacterium BMA10]|uniref:protein-tyrosine-phosphatase n=1 Tax=Splendidivirga corallicola TaxID=3051826 RepID=A0ABT8KT11_9BACT|nr:capsular biosynthesis protein [Fulvivirgaceae bacterium BMA10]